MKNAWKGKSQYDFYKKGLGRFLYKERLKYIKNELTKIIGTDNALIPKRMIDLGCGDGVLTAELRMDNLQILATDFDIDRILKARHIAGLDIELMVSDVIHPALKKETVDIILIHHVIEHIESSGIKIIQRCRDILKKDGHLIIGVPNEDSFLGRLSRLMHPRLYADGEHINYYSEKSIVSLAERNGFIVESIGRIGFLFPIYYIHMALISIKPFFYLGHYLTKIMKTSADSLIVVCKKKELE